MLLYFVIAVVIHRFSCQTKLSSQQFLVLEGSAPGGRAPYIAALDGFSLRGNCNLFSLSTFTACSLSAVPPSAGLSSTCSLSNSVHFTFANSLVACPLLSNNIVTDEGVLVAGSFNISFSPSSSFLLYLTPTPCTHLVISPITVNLYGVDGSLVASNAVSSSDLSGGGTIAVGFVCGCGNIPVVRMEVIGGAAIVNSLFLCDYVPDIEVRVSSSTGVTSNQGLSTFVNITVGDDDLRPDALLCDFYVDNLSPLLASWVSVNLLVEGGGNISQFLVTDPPSLFYSMVDNYPSWDWSVGSVSQGMGVAHASVYLNSSRMSDSELVSINRNVFLCFIWVSAIGYTSTYVSNASLNMESGLILPSLVLNGVAEPTAVNSSCPTPLAAAFSDDYASLSVRFFPAHGRGLGATSCPFSKSTLALLEVGLMTCYFSDIATLTVIIGADVFFPEPQTVTLAWPNCPEVALPILQPLTPLPFSVSVEGPDFVAPCVTGQRFRAVVSYAEPGTTIVTNWSLSALGGAPPPFDMSVFMGLEIDLGNYSFLLDVGDKYSLSVNTMTSSGQLALSNHTFSVLSVGSASLAFEPTRTLRLRADENLLSDLPLAEVVVALGESETSCDGVYNASVFRTPVFLSIDDMAKFPSNPGGAIARNLNASAGENTLQAFSEGGSVSGTLLADYRDASLLMAIRGGDRVVPEGQIVDLQLIGINSGLFSWSVAIESGYNGTASIVQQAMNGLSVAVNCSGGVVIVTAKDDLGSGIASVRLATATYPITSPPESVVIDIVNFTEIGYFSNGNTYMFDPNFGVSFVAAAVLAGTDTVVWSSTFPFTSDGLNATIHGGSIGPNVAGNITATLSLSGLSSTLKLQSLPIPRLGSCVVSTSGEDERVGRYNLPYVVEMTNSIRVVRVTCHNVDAPELSQGPVRLNLQVEEVGGIGSNPQLLPGFVQFPFAALYTGRTWNVTVLAESHSGGTIWINAGIVNLTSTYFVDGSKRKRFKDNIESITSVDKMRLESEKNIGPITSSCGSTRAVSRQIAAPVKLSFPNINTCGSYQGVQLEFLISILPPTLFISLPPTNLPSVSPSVSPTKHPTFAPTKSPTKAAVAAVVVFPWWWILLGILLLLLLLGLLALAAYLMAQRRRRRSEAPNVEVVDTVPMATVGSRRRKKAAMVAAASELGSSPSDEPELGRISTGQQSDLTKSGRRRSRKNPRSRRLAIASETREPQDEAELGRGSVIHTELGRK